MQRFIDKECYVYCATEAETNAFYEMCLDKQLTFTKRWEAEFELQNGLPKATFVYDWNEVPDNDGVSFWSWNEGGDHRRKCIAFSMLNFDDEKSHIDSEAFMQLL